MKRKGVFNAQAFLDSAGLAKKVVKYGSGDVIFAQGDPCDHVLYIRAGNVKLSVLSKAGKEAVVAMLGAGEFFGEGCLAGQPFRMSTAVSAASSTIVRVEKPLMGRLLHAELGLAEVFVDQLLSRLIRYEADLVDQMFNSAEKRLARMLLLLSHFGKDSKSETLVAGINQEHLAQMVGTTRSRINYFMNRFRKLGFINYDAEAGLTVHRGLLAVVKGD